MQRYDQALADCTHALQLDPTLAVAYYSRGRVYELQGQDTRARTEILRRSNYNTSFRRQLGRAG